MGMVTERTIVDAHKTVAQIEREKPRKTALGAASEAGKEHATMRSLGLLSSIVAFGGAFLALVGCQSTPINLSEYWRGPAPLRTPSPAQEAQACCSYEDSLTGGQVFQMYCSYCHNAPSLAERPYSQFQNVAAHMRVRANLTGKEYAKLMEFLRRWNDVPPPNPPVAPSAKRLTFSQPISELKEEGTASEKAPAQPQMSGRATVN